VVVHGAGDLDVTGNVGTSDQRRQLALGNVVVLLGGVEAVPEAALHDSGELIVDSLGGPGHTLGVLGHLETGNGDTTAVGGLGGSVPQTLGLAGLAVSLVDVDGLLGGAHVGSLGKEAGTGLDDGLGLLLVNLVLGGGGKDDIDLGEVGPGALAGQVLEAGLQGGVLSFVELGKVATLELDLGDELNVGLGETLLAGGNESTLGVGERDNLSAELDNLQGGVLGDVAGSGNGNELAREGLLSTGSVRDHVGDVVDETVSGGLGADQRSSPASSLSGDDTLELVAVGLVGTEHVSDLAATDTDVTGGNVSELTDVLGQLAHEGVAEAADLVVGLALGVEVRTSLTTTHHHYKRQYTISKKTKRLDETHIQSRHS
jgi:hypothetical protein